MSKTKIICFANNKGGSGKSTTCSNVGYALSSLGHKVLLIDGDMQLNLTLAFFDEEKALGYASEGKNIYTAIKEEKDLSDFVVPTDYEGLEIVPSTSLMSAIEFDLFPKWQREFIFRKCLEPIRARGYYDYILIDCPPSLGTLTVNALAASDGVVIPMTCEYYSLEGLSQLMQTIKQVKKLYNPSLDVTGILITMYDKRLNLSKQVLAEVDKYYSDKLFKTTVARNVRICEAPSFGMPVVYFDKYSKGAIAYEKVAHELTRRI